MTVEQVELAISEALDALPADVTASIEDIGIFVAESRADTQTLREAVTESGQQAVTIPQNFRAVFIGEPMVADAEDEDPELASGVILFNAAMLRDEADVVFTLMHEIGHALGYDEDEVAALGLQ